jgi:hypothetical protein
MNINPTSFARRVVTFVLPRLVVVGIAPCKTNEFRTQNVGPQSMVQNQIP